MNQETNSSSFNAEEFLKLAPSNPGVYRMLNDKGEVIYVGKAKNLKKRLSSYFLRNLDSPKTQVLVSLIRDIQLTVTHTENEALLLENNLIKNLRPRYNVVFRDDKSYPYIYLSLGQTYPRLAVHRGAQRNPGRYFGPYASAVAVRETLHLLQKVFPVRQCEDSFFKNRSRPCLQYQIKRCTAPCVDLISEAQYQEDVRHVVMFLEGKSNSVADELVKRMDEAALQLAYEKAAQLRDQIANLRRVQERQYVSSKGGDIDVVAIAKNEGMACVQLFAIRGGRNLGNRSYFPKHVETQTEGTILDAFIAQHYFSGLAGQTVRDLPDEILLSHEPESREWLMLALNEQAGRKISLSTNCRGDRARWVQMAVQNAELALKSRLSNQATMTHRFESLQESLELSELPQRLECFDISHSMGEATVASCVVFDGQGPRKSDYRRFNIEGITPGDDYAAMHQALTRRYKRIKEGEGVLPDVLFIDGGKGQVTQAETVMEELQIDSVFLVGVAKGAARKAGQETLCLASTGKELMLPADHPALHLIQQIRDEAHRFAITGHRQRRGKARNTSPLEDIPGLGPKRRQSLLRQFGGLQEVARAGVEDLMRVQGISKDLAQSIYDAFHVDSV